MRVEELGDQVAELSAHIQAATYRLLTLIRESTRTTVGTLRELSRAPTG